VAPAPQWWRRWDAMEDRVELTCPCCGTKLVADAATGEILAEERPHKTTKSFEDAVKEVRSGSERREEAFSKAFDRTRNLDDVLHKKFEEAKKKTKDDRSKPRSPFDLD
jgi:hypothetical protein